MKQDSSIIIENPWEDLKEFTPARIALGRCGCSLPTRERLSFQMSHAMARDAVHQALDFATFKEKLDSAVGAYFPEETLVLHSAVSDRLEYLRRPDLGRILAESSRKKIQNISCLTELSHLSIVIGDGLSSRAIEQNALPFLNVFLPLLKKRALRLAPLTLIEQSRVATADEVAFLLHAEMTLILIGERPGLSSPDSMGIYLTWNPQPGISTDEQRNCISNIRPGGMGYSQGAEKLIYLLDKSRKLKLSGVTLKDEQEMQVLRDEEREQLCEKSL